MIRPDESSSSEEPLQSEPLAQPAEGHTDDKGYSVFVLEPAPLQASKPTPQPNKTSTPEERRERWRITMEFIGVILLIATVSTGIWQAALTRETLKITAEQVHIGQRAYLSVESSQIDIPSIGQPLLVTAAIRNTGQTPARKVTFWGSVSICDCRPEDRDPPKLPAKAQDSTDTDAIGAGQGREFTLSWNNREPTSIDVINEFLPTFIGKPASKQVFAIVVIEYEDVFGGQNRTVNCARLAFGGRWTMCSTLNEMR